MIPQDNIRMQPPASGVKVRMYNAGFGDCFLLAFRGEDGDARYMLIDCGVHQMYEDASLRRTKMRRIVEDIAKATGNTLHVVVTTHEHWDHLVGFHYGWDILTKEGFQIDEVWLAWTEDLAGDPLAQDLHKRYEKIKSALAIAANRLVSLGDPWAGPIKDVLAFHWNFEELGVTRNELMDMVHKKLGKSTFYRSPAKPPFPMPGVPGIRFYALGPPRDERLLKNLEGARELYGEPLVLDEATAFSAAIAALGDKVPESGEQPKYEGFEKYGRPFADPLCMTEDEAKAYKVNRKPFFKEHYGFDKVDPKVGWRRIDSDWLSTAGQLALYMDEYTNNTSLVLAIELVDSGKVLLFPGDAQVGNWLSWKDEKKTSWVVEDGDGKKEEITGMKLVENTAFMKVSHHGSHNGTLVEYLEKMRADLVAMIPVDKKWAKNQWPEKEFPDKVLLEALKKKTRGRIIRTDTGLPKAKPPDLSNDEWGKFQNNVKEDKENKLWIEFDVLG